MAFGLKTPSKGSLVKVTHKVADEVHYAKNFIVERNLLPHAIVILLGLVVALCNAIVVKGANDLYDLIPADPASQVSITNSIDQYTPLISSDALTVEKLVTSPTDSSNDGFAMDVKIASTQKTERPVEQVAVGPRTKTISYTVENGDTLSGLGMKFNVEVASIKFTNSISNIDMIKPGQSIKIPPEGYKPTAKEIAAKEKKTASATSVKGASITVSAKAGSKINGYPYGYCTYYVATRRAVPASWGNAGQWLNSANRAGYSTGSTPVAGAILVTRESWWGHVAFVESVSGGSFTVAEMNYNGWGVTSRRTVNIGDSVIKGFVY